MKPSHAQMQDLSRDADLFIEEQQRLLRALMESLDREKAQIRQLNRVKECLVATTLKLQVATKAVEIDEVTIKNLRKDLHEAQQKSKEAISKQEIAADLIQALRLEIIQLNGRLKDQMSGEDVTHSIPQSAIFQEADNQVENMMFRKGIQFQSSSMIMEPENLKVKHIKESRGVNRPTDFQEWKMKKFLWAPDTPAGSENYDSEVVSELLQTSLHPPKGTGILRSTTPSKKGIQSFEYSEYQDTKKKTKKSAKDLPNVKSFSRKYTDLKHRPKTSQIF